MMAERYLALVGMLERPLQSALDARMAERGLERHCIAGDLILYATAAMTITHGPGAVVIGSIFGGTAALQADRIEPVDVSGKCWGNYLAFGLSGGRGLSWILRAPVGHLPALRRNWSGAMLLSSHADLLFDSDEP